MKPNNQTKHSNKEGWARPMLAGKFHYFQLDGMSLCRKWMLFPTSVDDSDPMMKSKDNCVACYRKLMQLETKQPN